MSVAAQEAAKVPLLPVVPVEGFVPVLSTVVCESMCVCVCVRARGGRFVCSDGWMHVKIMYELSNKLLCVLGLPRLMQQPYA